MTSKWDVGLVTYGELPGLNRGDRSLLEAIENRGVDATAVCWDGDDTWQRCSHLLLRSTWNYHRNFESFLEWVGRVEDSGIPLWNSPDCVRWNARKTYLRDLRKRGVDIVPTRFISTPDRAQLESVFRERNRGSMVLKPVVGAGAAGTKRVSSVEEAVCEIQEHNHRNWLAQPFMEEVVEDGEWSLVFFGSQFSHAVLKTPANSEYRVQKDYGGTVEPARPAEHLVSRARDVLEKTPFEPEYARVDGIVHEDRFLLVELELIEPNLYLEYDGAAPERFADRITNEMVR